jgi:hypothetical protein
VLVVIRTPAVWGRGLLFEVIPPGCEMDVKGQHDCERYFLIFMWLSTGLSFGIGLVVDNFYVMFGIFGCAAAVAFLLFMPDFPWFNRSPLQFRKRASSKLS